MWIYSAESILDNKEYNFAYVDDTLIDAILQIKIKNKIQIVEVNNIDSKNDNIKLNDIDDLSIIAKNKFDKLPIDTISFFDMTDKNTIKNLVNLNANNFDYASDELKKDVAFVRALLNKKGESIQEDKFDVLKYNHFTAPCQYIFYIFGFCTKNKFSIDLICKKIRKGCLHHKGNRTAYAGFGFHPFADERVFTECGA